MAAILKFKKQSLKEKHKGNTLCRNGHHKWQIETEKRLAWLLLLGDFVSPDQETFQQRFTETVTQ
jgi:hypothetical protein